MELLFPPKAFSHQSLLRCACCVGQRACSMLLLCSEIGQRSKPWCEKALSPFHTNSASAHFQAFVNVAPSNTAFIGVKPWHLSPEIAIYTLTTWTAPPWPLIQWTQAKCIASNNPCVVQRTGLHVLGSPFCVQGSFTIITSCAILKPHCFFQTESRTRTRCWCRVRQT